MASDFVITTRRGHMSRELHIVLATTWGHDEERNCNLAPPTPFGV